MDRAKCHTIERNSVEKISVKPNQRLLFTDSCLKLLHYARGKKHQSHT